MESLRKHFQSPTTIFWVTTLTMYFGWSLVTACLPGNLPFDHIEMLVWGKAWQLSYWKHPPLPAWVTEAVFVATNRAIWPQFFIGPATTATAAWVVWRAARDVAGPWRALIAALSLQGCIYYSHECDVINHNSIQLPFVAALIWAGWRGLRGSSLAWICFGACSALAIYGKHSAAFAPVGVLVFTLINKDARRLWRTAGPYLGLITGTIVMVPHLIGLWQVDFLPFQTAFMHRTEPPPWWGRIAYPAEFVSVQLVMTFGVWIMMFLLFAVPGQPTIEPESPALETRKAALYFLWCTAFPLALAASVSCVLNLHLHSLWAMAWLPYTGLVVLLWVRRPIGWSGLRTMGIAWCALAFGTLGFVGIRLVARPHLTGSTANVYFNGEDLAEHVGARWKEATDGAPLGIVIGSYWIGGNVCVYHPEHPDIVIDAIPLRSSWVDLSRISVEGAILVWEGQGVPEWIDNFGAHTEVERFEITPRTTAAVSKKQLGMAIILPAGK